MDWSGFEPEAFPVQGGRYTRFNYQPPEEWQMPIIPTIIGSNFMNIKGVKMQE